MTITERGQLATDVANELERRKRRRRIVLLLVLAALIALAVLYGTCGRGWGLGAGKGGGTGTGTRVAAPAIDAGPRRCNVRVTATGIRVDGKPASRDEAVAACKATTGADVVVTGDARQGDWDALRTALETAGVTVYTKQR